MKMELKVSRRIDYDNQYEIDIDLEEDLTKEEYGSVVGAIKTIETIVDPYIERAKKKALEKESKNVSKT